jgi:ABC-type sugar transport system substrate-binding protein
LLLIIKQNMRRMERMKKRVIFMVALLMIGVLVFTACGKSSGSAPTTSEEKPPAATTEPPVATTEEPADGTSKGQIAFLNYVNAHPYFQRGKARAIEVGKELGYDIAYDGPPDVDTPKFVSLIEDYSSKGVKALVVAALDDTTAPALIAAREKGIKVVTWDADVTTPGARDIYAGLGDFVPATGGPMAESLVQNMGPEGDWAMIDGELSMQTVADRSEYIINYLKEKYPKLNMVAREIAGEDTQKAYSVAQNLLTAYPNIKCILSNTSAAFAPACKVVEEYGLVGKTYVCGETMPSGAKPGMNAGVSKCAYTWDTADWAEFALRIAVNLLEGVEMPEGPNPNFKNFPAAERHGDVMYYGKGMFLTPENVNDFGDY